MDSTLLNHETAPLPIGSSLGGGYLSGAIFVDGCAYALIVSPKALGEKSLPWKTKWDSPSPGAQSINDGLANSEAMNDSGHPAAQWCRSLDIGGYSDWYLPSRDELELCYRNLKPTMRANFTYPSRRKNWSGDFNGVDDNGNGHNASSKPHGRTYTKDTPSRTHIALFQDDGAEAFESVWYWSSTEFGSAYAWIQGFDDGTQGNDHKGNHLRVRAVRKFPISDLPLSRPHARAAFSQWGKGAPIGRGYLVRDIVTEREGFALARIEYANGQIRFLIQHQDRSDWVDVEQIDVIGTGFADRFGRVSAIS